MEAFPLTPEWVEESGVEFKTKVIQFEGGYEQRTPIWNAGKKRFRLRWKVMDATDMGTLLSFFEARKGQVEAFTWTHKHTAVEYTVRFNKDSLSFTHLNASFADVNVEVITCAA